MPEATVPSCLGHYPRAEPGCLLCRREGYRLHRQRAAAHRLREDRRRLWRAQYMGTGAQDRRTLADLQLRVQLER
jgi:hypothetical protein